MSLEHHMHRKMITLLVGMGKVKPRDDAEALVGLERAPYPGALE